MIFQDEPFWHHMPWTLAWLAEEQLNTPNLTGKYTGNYVACLNQIKVKDCFCSSQEPISNNTKLLYLHVVISDSLKRLKNALWNSWINNWVIACSSHAVCLICLLGEHSIMERFTSRLFALVALVNVSVLMGHAVVDSLRGFRGTSKGYEDQIEPYHWWGQRSQPRKVKRDTHSC